MAAVAPVDDEDELGNDEGPTVMSGRSYDVLDDGTDGDELLAEPTVAAPSADGFGGDLDKTVASPSFDEMERQRAQASSSNDALAFAKTAMGPSYDERVAAAREPARRPEASPPIPAPASPPAPTGRGPERSPFADEPEGSESLPKTMVLGPNDWGPGSAPGATLDGPTARDPFAPHGIPGGAPYAPSPAGPATAPQPAPPAKKSNATLLFLVGLAIVLVFGGVAGGTLLLILMLR